MYCLFTLTEKIRWGRQINCRGRYLYIRSAKKCPPWNIMVVIKVSTAGWRPGIRRLNKYRFFNFHDILMNRFHQTNLVPLDAWQILLIQYSFLKKSKYFKNKQCLIWCSISEESSSWKRRDITRWKGLLRCVLKHASRGEITLIWQEK